MYLTSNYKFIRNYFNPVIHIQCLYAKIAYNQIKVKPIERHII